MELPKIIFKAVSSLEKVFPDCEPVTTSLLGKESILKGESYSFQIAFTIEDQDGHRRIELFPRVSKTLADSVTIKNVTLVPCEMTKFSTSDDDFIRSAKPGLYPDVLSNIGGEFGSASALNTMWRSVWVEFKTTDKTKAGEYNIDVEFLDEEGNFYGKAGTTVKLIDKVLPPQELIFTQWFHGDCIASYYNIEMLSDRHFELMGKFIKTASENGINMLLVPLFTPPLDTKVGGERPTIQLVDVCVNSGEYSFCFDKLHRFIKLCKDNGIKYFEMSHLFTQWGAKAAPKIMACVDGEYKRIFGWETEAAGEQYKAFLSAFLPQLVELLNDERIAEYTYFHVSDEPFVEHEDSYKAAADIIAPYLKGFKMIDALSDYSFFEKGLVPNPIPATNHIKPFLEHNVKNLWTYYCCCQGNGVSNRFLAMSSARNRAIAPQLFKYDIKGFLQWGYNFYYSQYSARKVDPFAVTDAGLGFPGGDSFSVYPGDDGPLESLRIKVFMSALCDMRAMQLCSELIGKQATLNIIEEGIEPIEFDKTPYTEEFVLSTRIKINNAIEKALGL